MKQLIKQGASIDHQDEVVRRIDFWFRLYNTVVCGKAWKYGSPRSRLERVQSHRADPLQGEGEFLHQEPWGICSFTPVLPKRAQRDMQGSFAARLQARYKEQRKLIIC